MKRIIITLCVVLFSLGIQHSFSQEQTGTLQGRVTDSLTGLPIESVTVFVPYTTAGTTSNKNGEFILESIPAGQVDIMFRHVAYQTASLSLNIPASGTEVRNIKLPAKTYSLDEITRRGKKADQQEGLILFKEHFLGNRTGITCVIKNPEDLFFYYDEDVLQAVARKPLIIINRYLGYEITYFLDYYKLYIEHIPDDPEGRAKAREGMDGIERVIAGWSEPVNTAQNRYHQSFSGSALYRDLAPKHPLRGLNWKLNREAEFSGNLKHFLICLYRNRLPETRYQLRKARAASEHQIPTKAKSDLDSTYFWNRQHNEPDYLYYSSDEVYTISDQQLTTLARSGKKQLKLDGPLLVFYDKELTKNLKDDRIAEISLNGQVLSFDSFGNFDVSGQARLWIYHDSGAKLSVMLPNDFLPKGF